MSTGIMIIGPSGSGKTTLGKIVAQKLGYLYFDVDDYIWKQNTDSPYGAMHFGVYGKQRGWVRAGFSQGIPDKADSDGFMAVPKQLELEIPFK